MAQEEAKGRNEAKENKSKYTKKLPELPQVDKLPNRTTAYKLPDNIVADKLLTKTVVESPRRIKIDTASATADNDLTDNKPAESETSGTVEIPIVTESDLKQGLESIAKTLAEPSNVKTVEEEDALPADQVDDANIDQSILEIIGLGKRSKTRFNLSLIS